MGHAWPSRETWPKPQALLVEGTWVPAVSPHVAATAEDFQRAYNAYHDQRCRRDDWAVEVLHEARTFEERLTLVECLLDADLCDFAHGCLAAGPVEDLISHRLLDHVEGSAERRARWVPLLRGTYWHNEPPDIQQRMRALLGDPA